MLPIAAMVCLICIAGAIFFALGVYRTATSAAIATLPVDRASQFALDSAGEIVIEVETPRLADEYRAFEIEVVETSSGQVSRFAYRASLVRTESYGVTTMKVPFGRMPARAGTYLARVHHIREGADHANTHLVISRPYAGRLAGQIVALVLCSAGALGCLIWAVWLAGWMKQSG